jgi:hypothetical protein
VVDNYLICERLITGRLNNGVCQKKSQNILVRFVLICQLFCWQILYCYWWKRLFDFSLMSLSCLCNAIGLSRLALGKSGGGGRGSRSGCGRGGGSCRSGGYNRGSTLNFGRGFVVVIL